jgi:hypothetical protein
MGDLFDEDDSLVFLEIDTSQLKIIDKGVGFEYECLDIIKPKHIKRIYNEDGTIKKIKTSTKKLTP